MTDASPPPAEPATRPPHRRIWRLFRWVLLIVVVFALLLVTFIALALFNERTGSWLLSSLNRWLPALTLEEVSGTLADGLQIGRLRWESESFRLEADHLQSQWQLGCLRQNTLCLDHLRAQRLAIWTAEAPEDTGAEEDEPFQGVQLPDLDIPWQFNVGQLQVQQLTWQRGEQSPIDFGHVEIRGVVAGTGWALHQVLWRFDDPLLGEGDLELAGHLDTTGNYPVSAKLAGLYRPPGTELPFERWQLRLDGDLAELGVSLDAAGESRAQAEATLDLTRADLPFRLLLEADQAVRWQDLQITDTRLVLSGSLERYQADVRTRLQLPDQPEMALSLSGAGDLGQLAVESLQAQVDESQVMLQGQLDWQQGVQWQGQVRLQDLNPAPWASDWPGRISGEADTEFALEDDGWALTLENLGLKGTLREHPVELTGGLSHTPDDHWLVRDVLLRWGGNRIFATGELGRTWQLKGEVEAPDLAVFAPDLAGSLAGHWQLGGDREDPRIQVEAQSPLLALGENRIEQIELKAQAAPLTLSELDVQLSAAQGVIAGQPLSELSVQASGNAKRHELQARLGYQGYQIAAGAQGRFEPETGNWSGVLDGLRLGQGQDWSMVQEQPAALAWVSEHQHLTLETLCLADADSHLCADLRYQGQEERVAAGLDLDSFLLSRVKPLLEPFADLEGQLTTRARVVLAQGELEHAEATGDLQELRLARVGERELPEPFRMPELTWNLDYQQDRLETDIRYRRSASEAGRVQGHVDQLSQEPVLDLALAFDELSLAELTRLAGLELQVSGTAAADVRVQGGLDDPAVTGELQTRHVSVQADEEADPWFRDLDLQVALKGRSAEVALDVTAPEHLRWVPESPAVIEWQGQDQVSLGQSCWIAEQSRLCLLGTWAAQDGLDARLELNADASSALGPVLPEGLALVGGIELETRLRQPEGESLQLQLDARLESGEVNLSREDGSVLNLPVEQLALEVGVENQRAQGQLQLKSPSIGQGQARFALPLEEGAAVDATWNIDDIQLALLQPFFPQIAEIGGQLQVEGKLAGTLDDPRVNGRLNLTGGHVASASLPVPIRDLEAVVAIENNQVSLEGNFASGKGQGTLSGEGVVGPDWHASIQLQGQNIPVVQRPELDLTVQPDLNLRLSSGQIFLGGRLAITDGVIELQPLPPGAVEVSSDVVFVDQREEMEVADMPWAFRANLTVTIADRVLLTGMGAQARLKGSVNLIQDQRDVLTGRGTIDVVEGRYERFGQRLKIRSGQILFNGPVQQPYITLEAVRETETVLAGVRVSGPIDQPELSLFSEPSLPDDTIMYYLLTGNAPGTGVGDEQALANRALLGLGLYGGTPLAQEVAETLGVEQFDVTTSGEGDTTAVNLSGYLSPRLYVQYGIGVFSPVNTLTLRYRLRPNLFVEAVNGIENILDLLYTFEF